MLLDDGINQVKNIFFGFYGTAKSVIHLLSKGIDVFLSNLYSTPGHGTNLAHTGYLKIIFFIWAYVGLKAEGYENSFGV